MNIQNPSEFQSFLDKEGHGDVRKRRKWLEAKHIEIKNTQEQISDEVRAEYAEIFKSAGREDLANKITNDKKPHSTDSKSIIETAEVVSNKYLVPQQLAVILKKIATIAQKKSLILLNPKAASIIYVNQPTDEMLEYDKMLHYISIPVLSPFYVKASWLREAGIDPTKIDGYKPNLTLSKNEQWFDYTDGGREIWSKEAEQALNNLGYTILRRPKHDGSENKLLFNVLLSENKVVE